ncbi:conserved hypothetical protein [Perkinsus marinus ATCC 50983]|uniref:Uncharacterized protein n=1 Tax=Perkinsus marinus (strain ATCC 50983 / TXsc) TaxID=423536 RepID=C5L323_PERM5|nr:conserved hypothetical protein [Perkinsus marinus ATCC 50983]EER08910.1 conserved hypothetical protein [Perkinsus marinus ATCC 50983]|eukprot:XP_002777094.1 conserved hypothetical protein [Perkinsus marinus ATCC 50983]
MSELQPDPNICFSAAIDSALQGALQDSLKHLEPLTPALDMDTLRRILDVYYHCHTASRDAVRKTEFIRHLHAKPSLSKALHMNPMMRGTSDGDSEPWAYIMPELAAILGDVITWADVLKAVHHRVSKPRATIGDSSGAHQRIESPPPAAAYVAEEYRSPGPSREDDSPSAVHRPSSSPRIGSYRGSMDAGSAYSDSVSAVHPFLRDTIEPAVASAFAAATSASLLSRQGMREEDYVPPIDMPPRHFATPSSGDVPAREATGGKNVYELLLEETKEEVSRGRSPTVVSERASTIRARKIRASHLRPHSATSTTRTTVPVGPSLLQREAVKSHTKLLASLKNNEEESPAKSSRSASFKARKLPREWTVAAGGAPGTYAPIVVGSHQTHVAEQEVRHRLGNTVTRPRRPDTTLAASMSVSFDRSIRRSLLERKKDPPNTTVQVYDVEQGTTQVSEASRARGVGEPYSLTASSNAKLFSSRTVAGSVGSQTRTVLHKALKSSNSDSEKRPRSSTPEYFTFYPQVGRSVPNFKALHRKEQERLRRRKEERPGRVTRPEPFSFTISRDEEKAHRGKEELGEPQKPTRKRVVGPPSFVERDRIRDMERREKLMAERQAEEAAEAGRMDRPKSPLHKRVHHAVGPQGQPVGSEELARRKREQARAAKEWREEVKRMLERVSRQPLLMERVTLDASKERARQKALVKIKKELIAKKVSNWQSYFQKEELNILEMAELQEILGRGKEEEEEDDYVSDDTEIMEEASQERPLAQEVPMDEAREIQREDPSSVEKEVEAPGAVSDGGARAAQEGDAPEGSDIWLF